MKFLFKVGKKIFTGVSVIDLIAALTKKSKSEVKRLDDSNAIEVWVSFEKEKMVRYKNDMLKITNS
jgi:hypothetical protein